MLHLVDIAAVLALSALPAGPPADESAERIMVLDIRNRANLDTGSLQTLNEVLLEQLHRSRHTAVLGGSDLEQTLGANNIDAVLGTDDASWLAAVASAVGAKYLIVAAVGIVQELRVVTMKLLRAEEGKVIARCTRDAKGSGAELLQAVRACADQVIAPLRSPPAVAASAAPEIATPSDPPPQSLALDEHLEEATPAPVEGPAIAHWVVSASLMAGAAGAAATAAVFGVQAQEHHAIYSDPAAWGRQVARARGIEAQTVANVSWVVSAALAAGAVMSFVLLRPNDDAEVRVGAAPGAMVVTATF